MLKLLSIILMTALLPVPGGAQISAPATMKLNMAGYDIQTSSGMTGLKKINWSDGTVQTSAIGAGSGDNLGNHTATSTLKMGNYAIFSSSSITAAKFYGNGAGITGVIASGDNLGNHVATKNLDMQGKDIVNARNITATNKVTAPYFYGDGSNLTGILDSSVLAPIEATLSTAAYLQNDQTFTGYNIYTSTSLFNGPIIAQTRVIYSEGLPPTYTGNLGETQAVNWSYAPESYNGEPLVNGWTTDIDNAIIHDFVYAVSTGAVGDSAFIITASNGLFNIPTDASIVGISVAVGRYQDAGGTAEDQICIGFNNQATYCKGGPSIPETYTDYVFGGSSDLGWTVITPPYNAITPTPALVNDGMLIADAITWGEGQVGAKSVYTDYYAITVYYGGDYYFSAGYDVADTTNNFNIKFNEDVVLSVSSDSVVYAGGFAGDGSRLTNVGTASGIAMLASTQTFTGINTFSSTSTYIAERIMYSAVTDTTTVSGPAKITQTGAGVVTQNNSGTASWANVPNVYANDGVYAVASGDYGDYYSLKTTNYGHSIPTDATIVGVKVTIKRSLGAGASADSIDCRLVVAGSPAGDDICSLNAWGSGVTTKVFGGADSLWGIALTPAIVNASGFGFYEEFTFSAMGAQTASVDYVQTEVYYYVPTTRSGWSAGVSTVTYGAFALSYTTSAPIALSVSSIGYVTATKYFGDGSSLTGAPAGPAGADGKTVLNGASDPTTEGVDGDFFMEVPTSMMWGPKLAGSWVGTGVSLIGPTGAQGAQGPPGVQGTAGAQGIQGTAGATGAQGIQGTAGLNGADGATGPQGIQGTAGATGSQGIQGTAGAAGADGAQGIQGIQGTAGTNGADGATGPQGLQGIQGTAGANGIDGDDGALQNQITPILNGLNNHTASISTHGATMVPAAGRIAMWGTSESFSASTMTALQFIGSLIGNADTATTASTAYLSEYTTYALDIADGVANDIPVQVEKGSTTFITGGSDGQFLRHNGASFPTWEDVPSGTITSTAAIIGMINANTVALGTTSTRIDLVIASTLPLVHSANWDTAYSWGDHSGLYLALHGTADSAIDSDTVDTLHATSFLRKLTTISETTSPSGIASALGYNWWFPTYMNGYPSSNSEGHTIILREGSGVTELHQSRAVSDGNTSQNGLWLRSKRDGGVNVWTGWTTVLTDANYSTMTVQGQLNALSAYASTATTRTDANTVALSTTTDAINLKVAKAGDVMSGSLQTTSMTVTGNTFSVGGSTFVVTNGKVNIGPDVVISSTGFMLKRFSQPVWGELVNIGYNDPLDGMEIKTNVGTTYPNTSRVFIGRQTGNFGIGTTAPAEKLSVAGSLSATGIIYSSSNIISYNADPAHMLRIGTNDTFYTDYLYTGMTATNLHMDFNTVQAFDIKFKTTNTDRMIVKAGGNVGIGTTAPESKLHVAGDIFATGILKSSHSVVLFPEDDGTASAISMRIKSNPDQYQFNFALDTLVNGDMYLNKVVAGASSNVMTYSRAGNVGVGTINPAYNLEVNGSGKFVGIDASSVSVVTACIGGDCKTAWPTGGAGGTPTYGEDDFTATTDGSEQHFTLTNTPLDYSLHLTQNGVALVSPADYSLAGQQITMVTAPAASTYLVARYAIGLTADTASIYSDGSPIGTIITYPSTTSPAGYAYCNGAEVNRAGQYAALFAIVGTKFGVGDNSTTFNLPDFRGMFARGLTDGSGRDPETTRVIGSTQTDTFQGFKFWGNKRVSGNNIAALGSAIWYDGNSSVRNYSIANFIDSGYGAVRVSTETRPENIAVAYMIKYQNTTTAVVTVSTVNLIANNNTFTGANTLTGVTNLTGLTTVAANYAVWVDSKPTNTAGGTATAGAWYNRVLNTELFDTGNFGELMSNSVVNSSVTFAAGTYYCRWTAPFGTVIGVYRTRLYNNTSGEVLGIGVGSYTNIGGSYAAAPLQGMARFHIDAPSDISLQYRVSTTAASSGLGGVSNFAGSPEIYAMLECTKEQ